MLGHWAAMQVLGVPLLVIIMSLLVLFAAIAIPVHFRAPPRGPQAVAGTWRPQKPWWRENENGHHRGPFVLGPAPDHPAIRPPEDQP
jgi:hypothetical protein